MSLDQETIDAQLTQLTSHRQRLALLLQQQARLGAYTPPYVLIDIQEAQSDIRRIKEQLRADGVPVEDELNDEVQHATVAPPSRLPAQEQRNRRAMLMKVKTIWIEGLLEHSLAKELRIALDLTEQPDAVDLPLNALVQELQHPSRALPAGTPIIKVFDQMGGALLILGAPGAGKTTLLLELARDLIARAEEDEGFPIPVVFNLSSWAEKRRPLKEWLVEELNTKYDVPRKTAQEWMGTDAILPLLDGLDEVAIEHHDDCTGVINLYRQEYGLVPLAVCSRVADYEALTIKLRLQGAITVQPLTPQQVDDYLERAGEKLAGVRAALHGDAALGELLDTPLMLSIVALAYAGKSAQEVVAVGMPEERRWHLFDVYIETMFQRRTKQTRYTQQQMTCWLSWLAGKMVQHSQTVYYIEQMQPTWLFPGEQRQYSALVRLLSTSVAVLISGSVFALGGELLVGLLVAVGSRPPGLGRLVVILLFGLVVGQAGLAFGLMIGLVGLIVGLGSSSRLKRIELVERLSWSWPRLWRLLAGMVVFTLLSGLVSGLLGIMFTSSWGGRVAFTVIGALSGGLLGGLFSGVSGATIETKARPNQGTHLSVRNWLVLGLVFGLGFAVIGGLFFSLGGLDSGLFGALIFGLLGGLIGGLVLGLNYGGRTVLQHYTLRLLLYRNGSLPLRLVPFLDYCAERIFLRRVGGGYIFVHRLLMEHFASLDTVHPPSEPNLSA